MEIAHVVDSMEVGGAEVLVAQLSRFQSAAGHHVTIHCLYRMGPVGEQLAAEGFEVLLHGPGSPIALMRRLWRAFRRLRVDAVHCHNAGPSILAATAARLAGARGLVLTRHGLVEPPYRMQQEIRFSVVARLTRAVIAAVCQRAERNLRGAPLAHEASIVTVRNGTQAREPRREGAEVEKEGFVVLAVGRLNPAKDHATLLHSFAKVRETAPEARLWIAGGGKLLAELEDLANRLELSPFVKFLGERKDIGYLLSQADVFVMSSITEGLPISLLEALAAGVPAVVTDVGGMTEIVEAARAGRVVPKCRPELLAQAVLELRALGPGLSELGASGKAFFNRYLTLEQMASSYDRLYLGGRQAVSQVGQN